MKLKRKSSKSISKKGEIAEIHNVWQLIAYVSEEHPFKIVLIGLFTLLAILFTSIKFSYDSNSKKFQITKQSQKIVIPFIAEENKRFKK